MQRWILGALALAAALVLWVVLGATPNGQSEVATAQTSSTKAKAHAPRSARVASPQKQASVDRKQKVSKTERDALRQRILDGLRKRGEAKQPPESDGDPQLPLATPSDDDAPFPKGDVKDRSGGDLKSIVATINEDVMPLADECYELALATDPKLAGMLDLNLEIIADEDIGGLVESVDLGEENEIDNAEMTQCIQETILSTAFPALGDTGRTGARLTLRFEPPE